MKIRQGFVSNSSSSSFVIKKEFLSTMQIEAIKNHAELVDMYPDDAWDIYENSEIIKGNTICDNFNMEEYLIKVVFIPPEYISWGDIYYNECWEEE